MSSPTIREQMISQGLIVEASGFEAWLKHGQTSQRGLVDIIVRIKANFGYIKPALFPEHRVYFRLSDLSELSRSKLQRGDLIEFDVPPQQLLPNQTPAVRAVRILRRKGSE